MPTPRRRRKNSSELTARLRRLADALEAAVAAAAPKDLPALARALVAVAKELDAAQQRDARRHADEKLKRRLQPIVDEGCAELADLIEQDVIDEDDIEDIARAMLARGDREKRLAARGWTARDAEKDSRRCTDSAAPRPETAPPVDEAPAAGRPVNLARPMENCAATAPPRIRAL